MLTKTYKTSVGKTSNYQTSESSAVNDRQRILRNNSVEIMEDSSLSSSMTNSCSSIPSSSDIEEDQSEDENYGFESSGTHYTSRSYERQFNDRVPLISLSYPNDQSTPGRATNIALEAKHSPKTFSRNLLLLPPIITDYQSYLSIPYLSIL